MTSDHSGGRQTAPTRPDSGDVETRAIQAHLHAFFSAMLDADGVAGPGCFRTLSRQPHPFGSIALIGPGVAPSTVVDAARPLVEQEVSSAVVLEGGDDDAQADALTRMGFFRAESMCLMSVTPDQLAQTNLPVGYRFVEVGPDDDDRWSDTFAAGYEVPRPLAAMFGPVACRRRGVSGRYFAAEYSGCYAAVSMCADIDGRPGIYAVATRPEQRGKGLGAHLTAEPLRKAWSAGAAARGLLQSSQMGEPVYRRVGFRSHGHMALYVRIPETNTAS